MKSELLIATMFRQDLSFLNNMGVKTNYLVINQTDFKKFPNLSLDNSLGKVFSFEERGLSKSRNRALSNSNSDICIIADDDILYVENYEEIIINSYNEYKDADLIIFDFSTSDKIRTCSKISNNPKKISRLESLKVASVRITFKRNSIISNNIKFNENFGAGSIFSAGEENLFLNECFKAGLSVYYVPKVICDVSFEESTWFKGYDENFFKGKGAFGLAMFGRFSNIYILQFLIRKYKMYNKTMSFYKALKFCFKGKREYNKLINNQ